MKHLILIFMFTCLSQSLVASTIIPSTDTIPFKKWTFGVQGSDLTLGKYNKEFGLGVFAERRFSDRFGIEGEFTYLSESGLFTPNSDDHWNSSKVRLSLAGKYYFGENRRWFAKAGFQSTYLAKTNYLERFNERYPDNMRTWDDSFKNRLSNSFFIGLGHELPLKNGGALKFEFNYLLGSYQRTNTNFKIGYRF